MPERYSNGTLFKVLISLVTVAVAGSIAMLIQHESRVSCLENDNFWVKSILQEIKVDVKEIRTRVEAPQRSRTMEGG